jgi:hypothetical protein
LLSDLLFCGTNSWTVRERDRAFKENEGNGKLKISSINLKKFTLTFENGRSGRTVHAVTLCEAAMSDRRQNNT